jgi:TonB-dependent Receptor Plug Domain
MKFYVMQIILLVSTKAVFSQAPINFQVIDYKTQDVIIQNIVIADSVSYQSNSQGNVAIRLYNASCNIKIIANGFASFDTLLYAPYLSNYLISLRKSTRINDIIVKSNFDNNLLNSTQVGLVHIPVSTLKKIPALGGERDLIKALQFVPGIQFGHEGSTELIVRGGSNDQNLVLLDDVPVYNLNHLFGFLSILPSDAVKDVQLYKAGFPAQFGGRLSSVIDIKTKEGSLNQKSVILNFGMLSAMAAIDLPIIKNKWG